MQPNRANSAAGRHDVGRHRQAGLVDPPQERVRHGLGRQGRERAIVIVEVDPGRLELGQLLGRPPDCQPAVFAPLAFEAVHGLERGPVQFGRTHELVAADGLGDQPRRRVAPRTPVHGDDPATAIDRVKNVGMQIGLARARRGNNKTFVREL